MKALRCKDPEIYPGFTSWQRKSLPKVGFAGERRIVSQPLHRNAEGTALLQSVLAPQGLWAQSSAQTHLRALSFLPVCGGVIFTG